MSNINTKSQYQNTSGVVLINQQLMISIEFMTGNFEYAFKSANRSKSRYEKAKLIIKQSNTELREFNRKFFHKFTLDAFCKLHCHVSSSLAPVYFKL